MNKGDLCELPNELIKASLYHILEENGYKDSTICIQLGSNKGDNYMGCIYCIKASNPYSSLYLICKTEPLNPTTRKELRTGVVYKRETYFYKRLLPIYQQFQDDKGVAKDLQFRNHPRCFGTGAGFLFLNDLVAEGYAMYDRFKYVDFKHVSKAVEALGRFHAVSLALKDQKPDLFNDFKKLEDNYFSNPIDEALYGYFDVMFDHAIEALMSSENAKLRIKMKYLKDNLKLILPELLKGEQAEPYAVVTHGDCWNNNVMYKYENDVPKSACLLDYQMCRYGSPALDLSYYIFCCTDKTFRDSYYNQILKIYHQSLSDLLLQLGSDVSSVFPYQELQNQMKLFGSFGLIMATIIVKTSRSEGDEIPDVDAAAEMMKTDKDFAKKVYIGSDESMTIYRKRMRDVIRDVDDYGMLDFDRFL